MKEAELFKQNGVNPVWPDCIRLALSLRLKSREQAAAQQNEQARMHSPCTVLAFEILEMLVFEKK